ncbi:MAG TPA: hypothetical protein VKJ07_21205 [Mycobacteriales bacterium]|nr:hypothetical protein [Mycobacteriales bacterium]
MSQITDIDTPKAPNRRRRWIVGVVAALLATAIGVAVGLATSHSSTAAHPTTTTIPNGAGGPAGGGSNARSAPAAGGAVGTVDALSTSGFTMTTSAGQKVTVDETSSTAYQKGTSPSSASAIAAGQNVLALGTTNGTTITATQVIIQPPVVAATGTVVPFQRGAPTVSKQVGQIPAGYNQGSGTIVSGTTANRATEAALAAYPGGVVDRVVALSGGDFNVHYIGVNWPHHIFVDQNFAVVGAL